MTETPPQKLELRSLDSERYTLAMKRESSIQNRPQFLLPLLPAQRGWGANHALQRTASQPGGKVCGDSTAAGAAPVTPPATTCAPAGVAPRTSPACSVVVPAGAGSQRR